MTPEIARYLVYLLAFVAALAAADGLYSVWAGLNLQRKAKISRRLRALNVNTPQAEAVSLLREVHLSEVPALDQLLKRLPWCSRLHTQLEQAGVDTTVARFLTLQLALTGVICFALTKFTPAPLLVVPVIALAIGFGVPRLQLQRARRTRLRRFTELLPDTMDYLARSMRAGNPFTASLKSASNEMPEPIAGELRTCFEEMNFGVDLEQALRHLGERNGSEELRYFITAVLIQRTTGGNLAEVLGRIAAVMRSRAGMVREIAAISAEMNYSSKVLIALPFVMALMLSVVNPEYLRVLLDHPIGFFLIGIQLGLMAVGWYVIRQMINFRI